MMDHQRAGPQKMEEKIKNCGVKYEKKLSDVRPEVEKVKQLYRALETQVSLMLRNSAGPCTNQIGSFNRTLRKRCSDSQTWVGPVVRNMTEHSQFVVLKEKRGNILSPEHLDLKI